MVDIRSIDELAQKLAGLVPPGLRAAEEDLRATFRAALQSGLARMDLVTREEFEVQRLVLQRTREKLEALERQLGELEARQPPSS
ncbi:MAG TPA: accessory factor UbiK family protein [Xanthomonadales bacterium]|nr:accessory factor UbiK family protein [Xanthomonadales bacterium]